LLTGEDEPSTPSASSTPSESEESESEPTVPTETTEPTGTTATTEPTETTATTTQPTEATEPTETTEPTESPTTQQPPGQLFQLDPGDAYDSPRNVTAAFVTALFEGDCGNVRAYATADFTFFARRCERNPDAFQGSTLDDVGEAIAIRQGFNVQADITLNGEPAVLVFETTDLDGNWLISDLLTYE
jgi:hypothetical protein